MLDERGVSLRFGAGAAGQSVTAFAVNIGEIATIKIGADGMARLDLSRMPVPDRGRACFFFTSRRSGELLSLSRSKGFYNPLWERRAGSNGAADAPRSSAAILREQQEFESEIATAKAYLARAEGGRYRGGRCVGVAVADQTRPAFAFDNAGARRYGAARCAAVIGVSTPSCSAVRMRASLTADPAFNGAECDQRLADAFILLQSPRNRAMADEHVALARAAALAAQRAPASRQALARQCVADVAEKSEQALQAWRRARDTVGGAEQRQQEQCEQSVRLVTDEAERRAFLERELRDVRRTETTRAPAAAGTSTRDHPCSIG